VTPRFIIEGNREIARDLRRIERQMQSGVRDELRDLAKPVQQTAASLAGPYSGATAAGFKIRLRRFEVTVEQSLRKTTGLRPDYGALQMRRMLEPALEQEEGKIEPEISRMLDVLHARYGF
jgi:hypothetical protein